MSPASFSHTTFSLSLLSLSLAHPDGTASFVEYYGSLNVEIGDSKVPGDGGLYLASGIV